MGLKNNQMVKDEAEQLAHNTYKQSFDEFGEPEWDEGKLHHRQQGFIEGFGKHAEKYRWSDEDMCNFLEFVRDNYTGFGTPNLIYNKGKQEKTKQIFERYIAFLIELKPR